MGMPITAVTTAPASTTPTVTGGGPSDAPLPPVPVAASKDAPMALSQATAGAAEVTGGGPGKSGATHGKAGKHGKAGQHGKGVAAFVHSLPKGARGKAISAHARQHGKAQDNAANGGAAAAGGAAKAPTTDSVTGGGPVASPAAGGGAAELQALLQQLTALLGQLAG